MCLKAESFKYAVHEDAAAVALKTTKEVLGKVRARALPSNSAQPPPPLQRNCFSLDVELEGSARVREEGISYYYKPKRNLLVLMLEDESLRNASTTRHDKGPGVMAKFRQKVSQMLYRRS